MYVCKMGENFASINDKNAFVSVLQRKIKICKKSGRHDKYSF